MGFPASVRGLITRAQGSQEEFQWGVRRYGITTECLQTNHVFFTNTGLGRRTTKQ